MSTWSGFIVQPHCASVPSAWQDVSGCALGPLSSRLQEAVYAMQLVVANTVRVACWLQIHASILPDGLHPSEEGMRRLAMCLSPFVYKYS